MVGCGDDTASESAASDLVATAAASIGTTTSRTDGEFCRAMGHLIVLLAPTDESSPAATRATFAEAAGWFEQANTSAPAEIADDVADYKTAYDDYRRYLGTVDFNLDTVFSTSEGRQLAIDTSHSITPAIVEHVIGECGLSFGDEQRDPPATTER
jgi:hypothetical protein